MSKIWQNLGSVVTILNGIAPHAICLNQDSSVRLTAALNGSQGPSTLLDCRRASVLAKNKTKTKTKKKKAYCCSSYSCQRYNPPQPCLQPCLV